MLLAAAAILVGFIVLIWSADLFVAGAASIAENMGMSPIIIGLTIVSLGTSAPEILVSLTAAMSDAGDLAIGNAIGSNIANIGLVLGITVLVAPMMVHESCMKKEMPVLLLVTFGTGVLLIDDELSNLDAGLMACRLSFMVYIGNVSGILYKLYCMDRPVSVCPLHTLAFARSNACLLPSNTVDSPVDRGS